MLRHARDNGVRGGEVRAGPAEPGEVRCAGELPGGVGRYGWQVDFSDQAGGLDPARVVEEHKTLTVAGSALGDVGGDDPPGRADKLHGVSLLYNPGTRHQVHLDDTIPFATVVEDID